jgi:hypothetical protein
MRKNNSIEHAFGQMVFLACEYLVYDSEGVGSRISRKCSKEAKAYTSKKGLQVINDRSDPPRILHRINLCSEHLKELSLLVDDLEEVKQWATLS